MPDLPLADPDAEYRNKLSVDTPYVKHADPSLNEGNAKDRKKALREMLDTTQEENDKAFYDATDTISKHGGKVLGTPAPAGRIRGSKEIPAFKEFMQKPPDDVKVHDMGDGTVIFEKKNPPSLQDVPVAARTDRWYGAA